MDPITPPPGALVELDVELIDEGKFKTYVEHKLKQALDGLLSYEQESMDSSAAATVTVKLKIQRQKGSAQFMDLSYKADTAVPVVERMSTVRVADGKLLCQPSGSNDGDPDQQLFYDARGRIIGGVDRATGEVISPNSIPPVAGKIKHA